MAVTLKDIAARTGLSIPTVHQIISGYAVSFSKETRSKVLAVAKELDYRPNLSARSLQQRKSFLLGVLFYSVNNDYASDFARGLQGAARDKGYAPIFFAHANSTEELQNLEIILDRHVDALIANIAIDPEDGRTNTSRLAQVKQTNLPMVEVFGRFLEGVPSVRLDYYAAGLAATNRMIQDGHKRITLFTRDKYKGDRVPGLNWAANDFWRGYCDAVKKAGLAEAVVAHPTTSDLGPFLAAKEVLNHSSKPTAVVCSSIRGATSLLQYADRNYKEVPKGFAISAFGRGEAMLPREWPVTIFPAPVEKIGAAAAEMAFKLIHKESAEDVALPPEAPVVIHQSATEV
jgi:DNA-binding LacI/PurR family transcriptional regulator